MLLEVHPVDAGDHRGHGRDGHPRRDEAHVLVLLDGHAREVRRQDVGQEPVVGLDVVVDEAQVVGDVTEEGKQHLGHSVPPGGVHEVSQRVGERLAGTPELEDLTLEPVDRVGVAAGGRGEDLLLDLLEVLAHLAVDDRVVVDDGVHHGVQHRHRAMAEALRCGLEPLAHPGQRVALAVSHGDDEAVTDEEHDLTGLDVARRLDVAQGLEHDEHRRLVLLDLGSLVAEDGVLDGQGVQVQLLVDEGELVVGRVPQPDPDEAVLGEAQHVQLVAEVAAALSPSVAVDGLVHDHVPYFTTSAPPWRARGGVCRWWRAAG